MQIRGFFNLKKKTKKNVKRAALWIPVGLLLATVLLTILYRFVPVKYTPFMWVQTKQTENQKIQKEWVPLSKISKALQLAVIASEDQLFLKHMGFDTKAIQKAMQHNKKSSGVRGASTISQQTAKNVFLWPGRSWIRKALEVYFTFLIELFWSKERILEVYLNVIEMGKGVYGAQAASQYYYKKNASALDAWEASFLASILPNPSRQRYNPYHPTHYILTRQFWIMEQMDQLQTTLPR